MATRTPAPYVRRYYRSDDDRLVAGVAGGLADHLGLQPLLIRVAFVLLTIAGGSGLLMYAAFWVFVPQRPSESTVRPRRIELGALVGFLCLGVVAAYLAHRIGLGVGFSTSWPVFVAAAGGGLIWRQADQRDAGGRPRRSYSTSSLVRLGIGAVFLLFGLVAFLVSRGVASQPASAGLAAVAVIALVGVVIGPWLIRMGGDLAAERRDRIRTEERAELAARVHDSVLHTLALIQRNVEDPREVGRLARAQERDLRSWLYRPGTPAPSDRLGAAVEQAAGEVEDSYGVSVDVVVVGDAVLTDALSGLVQASREAMVNAAKSSGAKAMSVYLEVDGDTASVFVRDRGTGFDLDAVGTDRYGIRQSIIGRMQRLGGTATINTAPGEGTEVVLAMPLGKPS